ncbi:MAG: 2-dehydro-3-deoxygalactonokinase [Pseudacidovorax sp.]|nr:2-dehydro-3-deoxygalactonokinase [Pseudacidovorax sp.]
MPNTLVALDWGTTSLRGALIAEDGRVLEERSAPRGILHLDGASFAEVFEAFTLDWMAVPGRRCLIAGMAGSRQGWVEAPYCACPCGAEEIAQQVVPVEPGRIDMVPGLVDHQSGVPDVMRGEETQILGAMRLTGLQDGLFVLPGTHNKWAQVAGGRVTGFRTFMTGEFYALLSQHSILSRTLQADAPLHEGAFLEGVGRARRADSPGLLNLAFGMRALSLFERLSPAAATSYLSGLLIGDELRAQPLQPGVPVVLVGSPTLTERYALALDSVGVPARLLDAQATWAGAHALWRARQAAG